MLTGVARLCISGYAETPTFTYYWSGVQHLLIEIEGVGEVNFRGLDGKFWREGGICTSDPSQALYKKLALK